MVKSNNITSAVLNNDIKNLCLAMCQPISTLCVSCAKPVFARTIILIIQGKEKTTHN